MGKHGFGFDALDDYVAELTYSTGPMRSCVVPPSKEMPVAATKGLILKEGVRYVTRDGTLTEPLKECGDSGFTCVVPGGVLVDPYFGRGEGGNWYGLDDRIHDNDLVAEAPADAAATPASGAATPKGDGTKNDKAKADLTLCPLSALEAMARAFMLGEQKYGRHNFKGGMEGHRYLAAAMRHICEHERGVDIDPDSVERGMPAPHLGCALASIAMYLECQRLGTLVDTRYAVKPK